ncbi:conserved hypothetical protein [Trichormus variabilis ATCC 29413]|uniref:Uncharacterized protein n=3 Tax=Nostocaceae TaxID=1162 RepID=Q3M9D1_TRIV2|nr:MULTISPECIES: hypothetical protein [Nostocaceae]ABA22405.1 conserved hypothetical protein [Trichormus variabilis ATCC 29413]MBC1214930.1 hypothetical protein [Trichormus variabilis ARAD]MBC1257630.1 hypothetical protein [Trichormus variabilis V5]MBC1269512.1 hypothetical protein [Trichormus variabilis FSR]MBC1304333.1 hypothetical protein [Trichormus variabilis N2B]
MAFYVLILKEQEDERGVTYLFGPHEDDLGALWLDKSNGEVKELQETSTQNSQALFQRAAVKVRQYWKKGAFPEKTCWAS